METNAEASLRTRQRPQILLLLFFLVWLMRWLLVAVYGRRPIYRSYSIEMSVHEFLLDLLCITTCNIVILPSVIWLANRAKVDNWIWGPFCMLVVELVFLPITFHEVKFDSTYLWIWTSYYTRFEIDFFAAVLVGLLTALLHIRLCSPTEIPQQALSIRYVFGVMIAIAVVLAFRSTLQYYGSILQSTHAALVRDNKLAYWLFPIINTLCLSCRIFGILWLFTHKNDSQLTGWTCLILGFVIYCGFFIVFNLGDWQTHSLSSMQLQLWFEIPRLAAETLLVIGTLLAFRYAGYRMIQREVSISIDPP